MRVTGTTAPGSSWTPGMYRSSSCVSPCVTTDIRRHTFTGGTTTRRPIGENAGAASGSAIGMAGIGGTRGPRLGRHRCRFINGDFRGTGIPMMRMSSARSTVRVTLTARTRKSCVSAMKIIIGITTAMGVQREIGAGTGIETGSRARTQAGVTMIVGRRTKELPGSTTSRALIGRSHRGRRANRQDLRQFRISANPQWTGTDCGRVRGKPSRCNRNASDSSRNNASSRNSNATNSGSNRSSNGS